MTFWKSPGLKKVDVFDVLLVRQLFSAKGDHLET